jgi:hypothetical protein
MINLPRVGSAGTQVLFKRSSRGPVPSIVASRLMALLQWLPPAYGPEMMNPVPRTSFRVRLRILAAPRDLG